MTNIITLLQNILPYQFLYAFTLSGIIFIISEIYFNRVDIFSAFLSRIAIIKSRLFILSFILSYILFNIDNIINDFKAAIMSNLWLLAIYIIYEISLIIIRLLVKYKSKIPNDVIETMYQSLVNRHDNTGGFRVFEDQNSNTELWTTSQTMYGLLYYYDNSELVIYSNEFMHYLEAESQKNTVLWGENIEEKNFFLMPNLWAVIAMLTIISKKNYNELINASLYEKTKKNIFLSINTILQLQLENGGWSSHSQNNYDRTLPTVMSVWILSEAIMKNSFLNLDQNQLLSIQNALERGISLLIRNYNSKMSLWSNVPNLTPKRNTISLTIYVYALLSITCNNLKLTNIANIGLNNFLSEIHNDIMNNCDYCMQKDIDDVETDGPYDNVLIDSNGVISVTFYDWLPIVMTAIYASKKNGNYNILYDGIREKQIRDILVQNKSNFKNWYTYRLSVILISLSLN